MVSQATDLGNVNVWVLFAVIGFLLTACYFLFVDKDMACESRLKVIGVVSSAGVGFWALAAWVGWFVSHM